MNRPLLTLTSFLFFTTCSFAQNSTGDKVIKTAKVNVTVTDKKGNPRKGEEVIFSATNSIKNFSGKTAATGKFTLTLPAGDKYIISLKGMLDSAKYGSINIPAIDADQEYTDPFNVSIQYEPARTYTLDNVHFDVGKATLRPDSYKELEELADYLKSKNEVKIEVGGHTDNAGKADDNLKLSQQRANTIKNYLVKKGVTADRVVAKGYGATQPIADNDTEDGRQLNRRTEVKIL